MNRHVALTQFQQLPTHDQSCFVYTFVCLSYSDANSRPHSISSANTLYRSLKDHDYYHLKNFIYLLIFRERGREGERQGKKG